MASKYHATRCEWNGEKFDSKAEMRRYQELVVLEAGGAIRNLRRQVPYHVWVNGLHVCKYIADHVYEEQWPERGGEWREVVEDTKGVKTPAYRLKKILMQAVYGVAIRETS